jgi:hypothetical protein
MPLLPFIIAFAFFITGCTSRTAYRELQATTDFYKSEARSADSLRLANNLLYERNRDLDANIIRLERDLDQAKIHQIALNRNYNDLLQQHNQLLEVNKNILSTASYEKVNLTEQLAQQQREFDELQQNLLTQNLQAIHTTANILLADTSLSIILLNPNPTIPQQLQQLGIPNHRIFPLSTNNNLVHVILTPKPHEILPLLNRS